MLKLQYAVPLIICYFDSFLFVYSVIVLLQGGPKNCILAIHRITL